MSYEFMAMTDETQLRKHFVYGNEKLGKLELYTGSQGGANVYVGMNGVDITAEYYGIGEFEKGNAVIVTNLVKRGEVWELLGFRLESELLQPY
jgi:hypothetical protein